MVADIINARSIMIDVQLRLLEVFSQAPVAVHTSHQESNILASFTHLASCLFCPPLDQLYERGPIQMWKIHVVHKQMKIKNVQMIRIAVGRCHLDQSNTESGSANV